MSYFVALPTRLADETRRRLESVYATSFFSAFRGEWALVSDAPVRETPDGALFAGHSLEPSDVGGLTDTSVGTVAKLLENSTRHPQLGGLVALACVAPDGREVRATCDRLGHGEIIGANLENSTVAISNDYSMLLAAPHARWTLRDMRNWDRRMYRGAYAFSNMHRIPPGLGICATERGAFTFAFAEVDIERSVPNASRLRAEIEQITNSHLPKGRFFLLLSGGVDSGVLAASIVAAGRRKDCCAITLCYPPTIEHRDADVARAVARHLQIEQIEIRASVEQYNCDEAARTLGGYHPWNAWWAALQRAAIDIGPIGIGGVGGDHFYSPVPPNRVTADQALRVARTTAALGLWPRWARAVAMPGTSRLRHSLTNDATGYGYALGNRLVCEGVLTLHPLLLTSEMFARSAHARHQTLEKAALRQAFAESMPASWSAARKEELRATRIPGGDRESTLRRLRQGASEHLMQIRKPAEGAS